MANTFRRDEWISSAMGQAISGAWVYLTSQPTNPATLTSSGFTPPSPLVQLYSDPAGANPITQPVQTDGFGHAAYYALPGTYTVTYYSPQIGITTLPDQIISGVVVSVSTATPSGAINGSNVTYTLPTIPSNFVLLFLGGVTQVPGTNYTLTGNTITMVTPPSTGDQLFAVYL